MKSIRYSILILLIFFSLPHACGAADFLSTERFELDNGLIVLTTPMPNSEMVSVYGVVKTGSATEGEYLGAGLSHFMEHMLFKGTQRRGVGAIAAEVQTLGGTINAGTHFDYTIYTITVPLVHFEQAVDILSDMLMHPQFDPTEIDKERDVVLNEIRMYDDQPERYLNEHVFQTVYRVHPYRIPIIGFEELLKPLTRDDFLAYYHRHYVPNNMIISVAGGVASADAVSVVQKFFNHYPMGKYHLRHLPIEPVQSTQRTRTEYFSTDLVRISVAYAGVDVASDDMAALDALAMILGHGRGSRLYAALVDGQKIAHTVTVSNFTPKDQGFFEILVASREDHTEEILKEIDRQITAIVHDGVAQGELDKAVNLSLKSVFEELESSSDVAYRTALDEAVAGQHDFTRYYIQTLQELTSRDIARVAEKYLHRDRRSVVALRPDRLAPHATSPSPRENEQSIERVVLKNGLTILLSPNHTLPLVWMNMVFQGGVHQESLELSGLSHMTALVWPKASQRYSYHDISSLTEQRGISLSGFSGQNSFGLRMNTLSQHLNISLAVLADVVLHPLFPDPLLADEKQRVKAELVQLNDDIRYIGLCALRESLFTEHPMGWFALGTTESIDRMTPSDVRAFYQRHAVPSNAVLSVFGDFDRDEMIRLLQRYFGQWDGPPVVLSQTPVQPIVAAIDRTQHVNKQQAAVFFGVQAENFYHADRYALEVLGAIIGSPFNGRMFSLIREQYGLAYTLGGGYAPSRSSGEIIFQILTSSEGVDNSRRVLKEIFEDIRTHGVGEDELDAAKAYLIGRFERSMEANNDRSFQAALDELYGMGYQHHQEYARGIDDVTADRIQELAVRYLDLDRSVFISILPAENSPEGADGQSAPLSE